MISETNACRFAHLRFLSLSRSNAGVATGPTQEYNWVPLFELFSGIHTSYYLIYFKFST